LDIDKLFASRIEFFGAAFCIIAINRIKKDLAQTGLWIAIPGLVIGVLVFFGCMIYLGILRSA
jgi:hypothetical protein